MPRHVDSHPPKASVLICVLNGEDVIDRQLDALAAQHTDFPWEVVVADNGSRDRTRDLVLRRATSFPVPLRLVDASDRRGVGHARNIAARGARGTLLIYCDSDDEVRPGWLQAAALGLSSAPAVVGLNRELLEPPRADAPILNPQILQGVCSVQTCNFGVRSDVFFAIGGFDETLPPYGGEDTEFAIRLRTAGYQVIAAPEMEIFFRRTVDLKSRLRKVYSAGIAEVVVWHRHRNIFAPHLRPAALVRDLLTWPFTIAVTTFTGRRLPPEKIARGTVVRCAHLVGYLTWVLPDKAGPVQPVSREPVRELSLADPAV